MNVPGAITCTQPGFCLCGQESSPTLYIITNYFYVGGRNVFSKTQCVGDGVQKQHFIHDWYTTHWQQTLTTAWQNITYYSVHVFATYKTLIWHACLLVSHIHKVYIHNCTVPTDTRCQSQRKQSSNTVTLHGQVLGYTHSGCKLCNGSTGYTLHETLTCNGVIGVSKT